MTLYSRNVIECIKALYGDAEFSKHLVFKPERHYKSADKKQRIYHELHTGDWWWEVQVSYETVDTFFCLIFVRRYLSNGNLVLQLCPSSYQQIRPNSHSLGTKRHIHFTVLLATSQNISVANPPAAVKCSLHIYPPVTSGFWPVFGINR